MVLLLFRSQDPGLGVFSINIDISCDAFREKKEGLPAMTEVLTLFLNCFTIIYEVKTNQLTYAKSQDFVERRL